MSQTDPPLYSTLELGFINKAKRLYSRILQPLVLSLDRAGITPNQVTATGLIIGVALLFISAATGTLGVGLVGIWIHVFMDLLDGALARHQHSGTTMGSLIDGISDQLIVTGAALLLIYLHLVDPILLIVYLVAYWVLNIVSFWLGYQGSRISLVLRPRIFVYLAMTIDAIFATTISGSVIMLSLIAILISCSVALYTVMVRPHSRV